MTERTFFFDVTMKDINHHFKDFVHQCQNACDYVVRGKYMDNYSAMMLEFSAALQFPYYFGFNTAAFDECISDLTWIECDVIFIIISDFDMMIKKRDEESDFISYLDEYVIEAGNESMKFSNERKDIYILAQSKERGADIDSVENLIEAVKKRCHFNEHENKFC